VVVFCFFFAVALAGVLGREGVALGMLIRLALVWFNKSDAW
jgi:hypothetical protein